MTDAHIHAIVYDIVGAAIDVYQDLRGGLSEAIYEEALCCELGKRGIQYESQKELTVYFKGNPLKKKYRADIYCENNIIIELKAVDEIIPEYRAQLFNYLRVTKTSFGILMNFTMKGVRIEKYLYNHDTNEVVLFPSKHEQE